MDSEYKVGALCDLIASKNKNPIKENRIKKSKDVKTKPYDKLKKNGKKKSMSELPDLISIKKESETKFVSNVENGSKMFVKHTKKNKKIKDVKTEPQEKLKKIKINNSISELPDIESIKKESETVFIGSVKNDSKIFEKPIKKNKIKKSKEKIKTSKANEKINLSDVKYSLENIEEKSSIMTVDNVENVSNSFKTPIKKKKIKKTNDNSTKPNDKLKTIENINSISNIKSSPEYIEKESRTIFIGNVPVKAKMSVIKNAFKSFGEIETTRLRSVAVNNLKMPKRVSIMKKDFHPQRETANVYIRFKTVEQARSALVLNATDFLGHTIRVDLALNTNHKQNSKKGIFIGNLSFNIQEDAIWNFFKDCGIINAVRIVRDNATGVSKGFGYVDFESKVSVELALRLEGKKILDRGIRIRRIAQKNKNQVFIKKPTFKRTKSVSTNSQNFQGETMKSTFKNKKKPSKTDLLRRKIAKKLNN